MILKVVGEDMEPFPGGLKTFLLVATRMRGGAPVIQWVKARDQLPTIIHEGTPTTNKGSSSKCQYCPGREPLGSTQRRGIRKVE